MTSKKKTKYVRLDLVDQILLRPDTYVGSIEEQIEENVFVYDELKQKMKLQEKVQRSPALLRIFMEILYNALDNIYRSKDEKVKMTSIKVNIDKETGKISIWNDGSSIPTDVHEKEKIRIPTLIFGVCLSSSNYDDTQQRGGSGRNGYGAKLTNIFSSFFQVEVVHPISKDECSTFIQKWSNNMKETKGPRLSKRKGDSGWTRITWIPDFEKFKIKNFPDIVIASYQKLMYDAAMIAAPFGVNVYLNGEKIEINNLKDYASLYGPIDESVEIKTKDSHLLLTTSTSGWNTVAFTNGVFNSKGGVHVEVWQEALLKPLLEKFNKKGRPQLTLRDIRPFFRMFLMCDLPNPRFATQSKNKLTGPVPKPKVFPKYIREIAKWSVKDLIDDIIHAKELQTLKKTEKKKKGFKKIAGYDPANLAGSNKSHECVLIFTEGLSAKTYAVRGIQKGFPAYAGGKKGRDYFGIFPLRGKLLNVRQAKVEKISKNDEITNAIHALGLKHGVDYSKDENFKKLPYGKIAILTDADVDGTHISGLLVNFIHSMFSSLLQRKDPYIISMETPLVRIFDKTPKVFYTEKELKRFLQIPGKDKLKRKYHKGLGTSSNKEVIETFGERLIGYTMSENSDAKMTMIFGSGGADQRKEWLASYNPEEEEPEIIAAAGQIPKMTLDHFADHRMIEFSLDDCSRSIPHVMDGLKESQRKILYAVMLKKLNHSSSTLKVAQLAGYVAEKAAYHHGEQNLYDTIVKLANSFVGVNNIPLLFRDGQYGTRLSGGKDAAAGRYIFTKLDFLTRDLFPEVDDNLLPFNFEDGTKIEPKYFVPIIPMILVNGCVAGIGTGWSCQVPLYNPKDIVNACLQWISQGEDAVSDIHPWYRGFKGTITQKCPGKYKTVGKVEVIKPGLKEVVELPINMWTDKFKDYAEDLRESKMIKGLKNYSTPTDVRFQIKECSNGMVCTEETLKLSSNLSTTNIVLFTPNGQLKKYKNAKEVVLDFCPVRLKLYITRKEAMLNTISQKMLSAKGRYRFLKEVMNGSLVIYKVAEDKIIETLTSRKYPKVSHPSKGMCYEYLLSMDIRSFTEEKLSKLQKDILDLEAKQKRIESTSPKTMWKKELRDFLAKYEKWLAKESKAK